VPNPPGNNPPLAKAAREFLAGMELPAVDQRSDENFKLCGLISVMLMFATGLKEGADRAICSPSQSQLAELMHCSRPTIERMMRKLRKAGVLSKLNRGRTSCIYTIHKTHQHLMGQTSKCLSDAEASNKLPDPSKDPLRPIKETPSTHQEGSFAPSTLDTHWVSPLEKSSLEKSSLGDASALQMQNPEESKSKPSPCSLNPQSQKRKPNRTKEQQLEQLYAYLEANGKADQIPELKRQAAERSAKRELQA